MSNKLRLYKMLDTKRDEILKKAEQIADEIGMPQEIRGNVGLVGALSSVPGKLKNKTIEAITEGSKKPIQLEKLVYRIRELVKDVYGDKYDAAPVNTCEAGLGVSFDTLVAPSLLGRGDNYRARYIVPYEKQLHHHGGYGRPFPSKYKDIFADRGITAGELGFAAKRLNNLDTVIVPLVGGKYDVFGLNQHVHPLLFNIDPEKSAEKLEEVIQQHSGFITGVSSMAYDTPGYGYGDKDNEGTPVLQKLIGQLATKYNIPYIADNAFGLPFVGTDIRKTGADIMVYSMDKSAGAPTSGLIIGTDEALVPIHRALGFHGPRGGGISSYGQSGYVQLDPGKLALVGQVLALEELKDHPEYWTNTTDQLYDLIVDEFEHLHPALRKYVSITKTYNSQAVEVNYESSWNEGLGIPIFNDEDGYVGSDLMAQGLRAMGIISYDDNMYISPGLGTVDDNGELIEENMRFAVRGFVNMIELLSKYAGIIK